MWKVYLRFRIKSSLFAVIFTVILVHITSAIAAVERFNVNDKVVQVQDISDLSLPTCCALQSLFKNGECANEAVENKNNSVGLFPEFWELPERLTPRMYLKQGLKSILRLQHKSITCPNGRFTLNVSLSEFIYSQFTVIFPITGHLRHQFDVFYPDEYCFNRINEEEVEIVVCQPVCTPEKPCIQKCCEFNQVWDLTAYPDGSASCAFAGENEWKPQIYSDIKDVNPLDNVRPHIIIHHPRHWCEEDSTIHVLKPFKNERKRPFRILSSGEVWYKFDRRTWTPFPEGTYCVDGYFVKPEGDTNTGHFSGNYQDTMVWDCSSPLNVTKSTGITQLYGVSMGIAAIFMFITVAVYVSLWEKQSLHGWTLICYFTSLFFMYMFHSAVHFTSLWLQQDAESGGGTFCYFIGVGAHFFFLSSFCYMSAVNFDLWWASRTLLPTYRRWITRFTLYNIFSLGIPTVIVGIGVTLDQLYRDDPDSEVIIPEYGRKTCYLDRDYAVLPYLQGPAGVLLSMNLVFFTITVYKMCRISKQSSSTLHQSKVSWQKQWMIIFIKLFLVMGIPWISEVVSSMIRYGTDAPVYMIVLDMINIFQAIAIFIIFVLTREIRNSLVYKYPIFHRIMVALTFNPERAQYIRRRYPRLSFLITPLTSPAADNTSIYAADATIVIQMQTKETIPQN